LGRQARERRPATIYDLSFAMAIFCTIEPGRKRDGAIYLSQILKYSEREMTEKAIGVV
jgi:hypothetical protein